jgi:uncharacterized caspase-like protein
MELCHRLTIDRFYSDAVQRRRSLVALLPLWMGDVMPRIRNVIAMMLALIPLAFLVVPSAARAEKRVALVIGNAGYQVGALTTPANDAGLIAQTLQAAGFDVVGARDLDQDSLRRAFRDFLEKATGAGTDTVAFVYVSGYGVQLEGENYFVPIDAKIARDSDVAAEALRMSDYIRPLAALKLKASIVVLDVARANPFAKSGPPLAGGLALVEPEPGLLIAFNAAPGTVAPEGQGPYGPYAQALAEMIREGGLPLASVFDRARLRVNDVTKGAEVPWHASKVETSLVFFERAADAPPPVVSSEQAAAIRARPIRDLDARDAYAAALERDSLDGYSEFLTAYPDDPMAKRVRAIVAARREAITWRRTRAVDTPPAYWSYLRRYPEGPHAADAHRRLAFLAAAFEPPPSFTVLAYDLPPPPPEEIIYIRRPVLVFDDPVFAFAPPPPPVIFLAPPPPEFVVLAPPPPPVGIFVLPMPIYRPVPVWVRPPAYVAPPPNNVIYNNVHNTVVINNVTNTVTVTNPSGQTQTMAPAAAMAPAAQPAAASPQAVSPQPAPAAPVPAASLAPALPPSVAQKAVTLQTPQGGGAQPSAPGSAATQSPSQPGQPLPGMKGQPLPSATGTSATPTTPSAAIAPGAPSSAPGASAPPSRPAAKQTTPPSSPSAATTPGTPSPAAGGSAKPGTLPSQAPTATTTPSAAIAPGTSTPTPAGRAKRGTKPSQTPALAPTTPSAAVPPVAPSPASGAGAKPVTPPPQTPAAKPSTSTPSAAITPGTPSPGAKPAAPAPQGQAVKPPIPSSLQAPTKPVTASPSPPPGSGAKSATPSPQVPAASPVTPPAAAKPMAPAAAAAHPAPPAAPKVVPPQPKGCPQGKTMVVVNGQPVCK